MITKEQYDFLSAPYPVEDIEFLRGFAYVRERAINIRLSEIDPSWDYRIVSYEYRSPIHVVCMVEIKFAEIVRGGIGEQKNEGNNPKELDVAKGAETDAFKRAARKFGVGLYLTELPDTVKDYNSYDAWYRQVMGLPQQSRQNRAPTPTNGNNPPQHAQNAKQTPSSAKNGQADDKRTAAEKARAKVIEAGVDINEAIKRRPMPTNRFGSDNDEWANDTLQAFGKAAS